MCKYRPVELTHAHTDKNSYTQNFFALTGVRFRTCPVYTVLKEILKEVISEQCGNKMTQISILRFEEAFTNIMLTTDKKYYGTIN